MFSSNQLSAISTLAVHSTKCQSSPQHEFHVTSTPEASLEASEMF